MAERFFDGEFYKRRNTMDYMQCDSGNMAYLHVILGIFSELAGDEGSAKGEGYEFFMAHNMFFLVTRMSARIHRLPEKNETVVFSTWFRQVEGKFFLRDCEARSEDGELLLSMSGTWALLDAQTRRLADPSSHPGVGSLPHMDLKADAPICKKIMPLPEMESLGTRKTRYTDLDCNHHMNNSVYTKMAMDFLPDRYRERSIRDYVINFNREVRLGEVLELRGGETEHGYIIQGYTGEALHFSSEFTFDV